ncbi:MAG: DUF177 domain-containing protein [Dehalococcoidia bacterium]
MQFNVSQLLRESTGSARRFSLEAVYTEKGRFADSVVGEVHLVRTHHGVLVRANVDAQVRLTCARCLIEFGSGSVLALEEEFFPQVDVDTGKRLDLPEDSEGLPISANHILDLTEAIRQYVITNQPMKPLCEVNCLGLCQECGARLNVEKCNCSDAQRDPRWGALTALLQESKG